MGPLYVRITFQYLYLSYGIDARIGRTPFAQQETTAEFVAPDLTTDSSMRIVLQRPFRRDTTIAIFYCGRTNVFVLWLVCYTAAAAYDVQVTPAFCFCFDEYSFASFARAKLAQYVEPCA